jgi:hypothetical protein
MSRLFHAIVKPEDASTDDRLRDPMKTCKCGRPLVLNYNTGKYFQKCPLCREAANTRLRAHVKKSGGVKGIARL